ncbi:MAG: NmrA family NAD(P)-binding protein, partial [Marmoricola sp.]|nr:NmrA family NAD(P)-binding protein [Marmoricola sp.]
MSGEVAVTGATGAVGGQVARLLAEAGVPQRLLARSPERLPRLEYAEPRAFGGYGDRAGTVSALEGVSTLFMVSAEEAADRLAQHRAFVDAAVSAGVQHVV